MRVAEANGARRLSDPGAQIDALDGIRGVAVLLVLLSHLGVLRLVPYADFSGSGKAGVYLFFVLSAFLLTLGFLRKGAESLGWRELVLYALRRFLRIYPVFVVALALTCVHLDGVTHGRAPSFDLAKFWANLTLQRGDGVFWTIAVEFKYYLLIPLVAFTHLVLFRSRAILSAALLGAGALGAAIAWRVPADANLNIVSLAPFLPIFLTGSIAAILFHHRPALSPAMRRAASIIAWLAIAGAIALLPSVIEAVFGVRSAHQLVIRWIAVWAVLWGAMVLCTLVGASLPRRLFEARWLRRAGQLCLGSYLFHPLVIAAVRLGALKLGVANTYAEAWLAIGLVFVVAEVSLRLVEKPLSDTSRLERWARRPAQPLASVDALAEEPGAPS